MHSTWSISRLPIPHNRERGAAAVEKLRGLSNEASDLILGASGSSPYLSGIVEAEPEFVQDLFDQDPSAVLDDLLDQSRGLADENLRGGLRKLKRKVALLTALADLGGVWTLRQVTGALTDFADTAVDRAFKAMVAREARTKKLPGVSQDDAQQTAGGLTVLAMGKMGAGELNYSSDIDLICLFDEARYDADDYHEARASLIRATKRASLLLSEITGEGYVFRTDLRLRPDPSVTPVCLAMEAAERYYESLGRTWERAAYIKARACAGDIGAGEEFLRRLTPFVWRKHLDFNAIDEAHDMRLRIREHKGTGAAFNLDGHNVKLGKGGIREIEFFTQTRQIIAGGRDQALRLRETVPSLTALVEKNWVQDDVAGILSEDYEAHREVEHRLQMIADAQTHILPTGEDGFLRLARLMGTEDVPALRKSLEDRFHRVHELTEAFFASDDEKADQTDADHSQTIERWMRLPAMRSERARQKFRRLSPRIFESLEASAHPQEALSAFEGFLSGLPAGVQLFALFEANPQLVDLIVDIAGTAPALADYLGRNSGVLDAVIGGEFFSDWPDREVLAQAFARVLAEAGDYEARLDSARRFKKEWHFRIGVHHLRGLLEAEETGRQYAELAEVVLLGLWAVVVEDFASKHGDPPGMGASVVGMGSLGASGLNAGSDLDLIVIYEAEGVESSDGRRPLAARAYYARLTQALVTALSAPMAEGKLYEVDMRLRPSGRKGPVATAFAAYQNYQLEEAWGWEHLAMTRARPVAGHRKLGQQIEDFRQDLLTKVGPTADVLNAFSQMRERLEAAQPRASVWDVKAGPGGLRDIELLAQSATLVAGDPSRNVSAQIECLGTLGWITPPEMERLLSVRRLQWRVVAAQRLLISGKFDVETVGGGGLAFLINRTSQSGLDDLADALDKSYQFAADLIDRVIGRECQKK